MIFVGLALFISLWFPVVIYMNRVNLTHWVTCLRAGIICRLQNVAYMDSGLKISKIISRRIQKCIPWLLSKNGIFRPYQWVE